MKFYEKYISCIGVLANIMFFLQAYTIFKHKSAYAVSGTGFIISIVGLGSWLFYGVLLKNKPLIIANGFGLIGAILTIIGIFMYG